MVLEEMLLEECREAGAACPAPWGTMERLSPLLYTWAQVCVCCGFRLFREGFSCRACLPGSPCISLYTSHAAYQSA
jgi:hypothetical protein